MLGGLVITGNYTYGDEGIGDGNMDRGQGMQIEKNVENQ